MFDKLEDLVVRLEEILSELQEPDVANDQERFRRLMKEQNDLTPIVEAYNEYKPASRQSKTACRCWRKNLMKRCGSLPKKN